MLQAVYLTGNLSNSTLHSGEVLADARILNALRLCIVDGKADVRRAAVGCVLQLVKANPGCQKVLHDCGIDSTLRHMCEYGTEPFGMSGYSPTTMYLRMGAEYDREVKEKAREILNRLVITAPEWD
jgi:armadillo repeat-containing protein 8